MNENYEHPAMPEGVEQDILKGMYLFRKGPNSNGPRVQLLGSGTIFREAIAAADLLQDDWGVAADLWSATSFNELARDGHNCTRFHLLHPEEPRRDCHAKGLLADTRGPIVAATDYTRMYAEQIRPFVTEGGRRYTVLGTDGFGRSDTREQLRHFFEVDRRWITVAALSSLADDGAIEHKTVAAAIAKYGLDPDKPNPVKV
jgi:pyruvate dehydrogenase E1 component